MSDELRSALVQNYLSTATAASSSEGEEEEEVSVPDEEELHTFKGQVRAWMELDEGIKQAKSALKTRNETKKALTTRILEFMQKHDIDDLNTREGKLSLRKTMVAAEPLSQKRIKAELLRLHEPTRTAQELTALIFEDREKVAKPTLRRIRVRSG